MSTDSFRDFVLEQLAALEDLRCKRMFGGYGFYSGETFFGILFDGRLYFKTHPDTLQDYLDLSRRCFRPLRKTDFEELPRSSGRYSGRCRAINVLGEKGARQ